MSGVEKGKCFTIIDAIVGIQIEKDYTLYLNLEKSSCEKFKLTGVWYAPELDENGKFITNQYEELNNILNEFHYYDNIDANYRTYKAMMQKRYKNSDTKSGVVSCVMRTTPDFILFDLTIRYCFPICTLFIITQIPFLIVP